MSATRARGISNVAANPAGAQRRIFAQANTPHNLG
jgi:hypothetical protein